MKQRPFQKVQFSHVVLGQLVSESQKFIESVSPGELDINTQVTGAIRLDSRLVVPGDLFVAFRGENQDGHDFLQKASEQGAAAVVVDAHWTKAHLTPFQTKNPNTTVISTLDPVGLMASFSKIYRKNALNLPIIAITGSVGKTTVKNLVGHILQQFVEPLVTIASQNNHLGVPMTLSRITHKVEVGVTELGADKIGEIAAGVALVQPVVSVLTCVNSAHAEGFGSLDNTAQAKAEIFAGLDLDGVAVLNRDDQYFDYWRGLMPAGRDWLSFGHATDAHVQLLANGEGVQFHHSLIDFGVPDFLLEKPIQFEMPLLGAHDKFNGLIAITAVIALLSRQAFPWAEQFYKQLSTIFASVEPAAGRLQPHRLGDILLIDDTYNASPAAVTASLVFLGEQKGETWFVFGGMAELGQHSDEFHATVGQEAAQLGIDQFWAYGPNASISAESYAKHCSGPIACFETHEALSAALEYAVALRQPACILVKGARSRKMEKVVHSLIQSYASEAS